MCMQSVPATYIVVLSCLPAFLFMHAPPSHYTQGYTLQSGDLACSADAAINAKYAYLSTLKGTCLTFFELDVKNAGENAAQAHVQAGA